MDEPLSNLDAKPRQMRTEISKLPPEVEYNIYICYSDQTEALTMGTRIVVMKAGFVQQIDSPQNYMTSRCICCFLSKPSNEYTNVVENRR